MSMFVHLNFAFQNSSEESTCSSEYKISAQRLCSTDRLVCERAQRTIFLQTQVRGMTNVLFGKLCAVCSNTRGILKTKLFIVFFCPRSMSLYIDLKTIRSLNLFFSTMLWASWNRFCVVCTATIFHYDTTGSPSILSSSRC